MENFSRILHDLDQGNINVESAKQQVLDLFGVSWRSEQLKAFDELFDYAWNLAEYPEQHSKLNEIRERF